MIAWFVDDGVGEVKDLYSSDHSSPVEDKVQDLTEEKASEFDADKGVMTFFTRRLLDTTDPKDFIVKVNEDNLMCVAWKSGKSSFIKHDEWELWSFKVTETGEVDQGNIDLSEFLRSDKIEEHGMWMWSAWFVVGLLLLITKRYTKKTWTLSHYVHALLGYFTLVVTIIFALSVTNWAPFEELHNAIGSLCVVITIFGSLSGTITAALMRFYNGDKPWSKEEKV